MVSAAGLPRLADADLLTYVVDHLDVRTFPSSIGPRRQPTKVTFADYGFLVDRTSPREVELTTPEKDWFITVTILAHDPQSILICLMDYAANGGTYHARYPVQLVMAADGQHLRGEVSNANRADCSGSP
jgi:hypothetical protein